MFCQFFKISRGSVAYLSVWVNEFHLLKFNLRAKVTYCCSVDPRNDDLQILTRADCNFDLEKKKISFSRHHHADTKFQTKYQAIDSMTYKL